MNILIPEQLSKITGTKSVIQYLDGLEKGYDIKNMLSRLFVDYPPLKERLLNINGELNKFVNVYVNGEDIRFLNGIDTTLIDTDEVSIVPAMAGG